ncbi:hypothetical protein CDV31_016046 [Fusarium ambrosium]|uniref:Protein kinase domain-containing protein n=1 Tax=Fusarium ambrosium TaxID=131363 RepID=A0A428SFD5_9HYPO|nr:hypothetical protein CDV31_016046 [Fusarium ambrosium]
MAALAHIKSRSIIHNDIKPSNILYDPIKGAILIDFGLAASSSNRKLCTGGTPWYVAPEYLSQRRGPESDEYALGVVMLYLLKAIPLPDTTEQQWDISSVSQNPDAFSHMRTWTEKIAREREGLGSTSIEETTKHLLQPNPAERLSVVLVMASGQTH